MKCVTPSFLLTVEPSVTGESPVDCFAATDATRRASALCNGPVSPNASLTSAAPRSPNDAYFGSPEYEKGRTAAPLIGTTSPGADGRRPRSPASPRPTIPMPATTPIAMLRPRILARGGADV